MNHPFGKWTWRDWTIAVLGALLLIVGGLWARDHLTREAAAGRDGEGATLETVSVFDVILDRERRAFVDLFFDRPIGERQRGEILARPPATVEPALAGVWRWRDGHVLRFEPSGGFEMATQYRLALIPERLIGDERRFAGDTEFTLRTDRFLLEQVHAEEEPASEPGKIRFRGRLQFNYAVDPERLAPLIRLIDPLQGASKPVEVELEEAYWVREVLTFRTAPLAKTPEERTLRLVVDASLTPHRGNVPLGEEVSHEILLGSSRNLAIRGLEAQPGLDRSTLTLALSSPVDAEIARKYLSVEPETSYRLSAPGNALQLTGDFKPGGAYVLRVAEGLPARDEAVLRAAFEQRLTLDDLAPSLGFKSQGMFLSAKGYRNVAVESINVDRIRLAIDRVYLNNLFFLTQYGGWGLESTYHGSELSHSFGDRVIEETLAVEAPRNTRHTTVLPIGRYIEETTPGLYRVLLGREGDWQAEQRWLLLTDLGAVAKQGEGEVLVWLSSVTSLAPVAGAAVTLISDQNQTLGRGTTDAAGFWRFQDAAALGDHTPYLVTVEKGSDSSFLLLRDMAIDTAGLDVGGAPPPGEGYQAYLYGERDLYRPGETLEGLAVVRDGRLRPAPAMPAKLRHRDPRGVEVEAETVQIDRRGLVPLTLELPEYALTGAHTLELEIAEKVVGGYGFQVEEFIPDRIEVEIAPRSAPGPDGQPRPLGPGDTLAYDVASSYLFGAPAAALPVESRVRLQKLPFAPAGFPAFSFENAERSFADREIHFAQGALDEAGRLGFAAALPSGLTPPSGLEAVVTARVQEQGGRGVSARTRLPVHPYPYYLGLRRTAEGYPEPGDEVELETVAVAPDGTETAAGPLRAELYYVRYQTVLRRTPAGTYRYESTSDPVLVSEQQVAAGAARSRLRFTPSEYGKHRVVLSDPAGGASAAVEFYVSGWGYSPWAVENPSKIELDLDRPEYRPGETATVQVRAPFPGKLLLTVERERIFHREVHTLTGNTARIVLPIRADYRPNAYVTATLVRSVRDLEAGSVGRAFGAVPLAVDREANRLVVAIDAPQEVRSESRLEVAVRAAPNSVVTVAAVDEGILQLIAQRTADPFAFFYRKLALGVTSFDTFGLLLPDVPLETAPAGGGLGEGMAQFVRTEGIRRVEPVAFWSGALETDAAGRARAEFKLPEFQGALRVMAVALGEAKFGAADLRTRVRDPVVLLPTLPRILSFGEALQVPVSVRNDSGGEGEFKVRLAVTGPARLPAGGEQTVTVPNGAERTVTFTVDTGQVPGEVAFAFTAEGRGERARASGRVGVRADLPPAAYERTGSVAKAATELPWDAPVQFRAGTARRELRVGPLPLLQFAGKLRELLRYPFGCLEQVTSQAFPLLYLADLAAELDPELLDPEKGGRRPEAIVEEALRRVALMQLDDGGFSLWPGGGEFDPWASVHATHLLVEAERAGYRVGSITRDRALDFLDRQVRAKSEYGGDELERTVYALWVLGRAGRADLATMDFVRAKHAAALGAETRAMLAAAYAEVGNPQAIADLLARLAAVEEVGRRTGGNFDSAIRNRALVLLALLSASPDHPRIPELVDRLARDSAAFPVWTTQESGFALLALGQFFHRQAARPPYRGAVWLGEKKLGDFSSRASAAFNDIRGDEPLKIVMEPPYEAGSAFFSLLVRGIPTDESFAPERAGLRVEREFLTREKGAVDLAQVKQGDLLVVRTRVRSESGPVENVAITQLLPSGLEVENPRLESTEALPWITDSTLESAVVDLRDDRILVFTSLPEDGWCTFYTLVRAVAPGSFRLPPVQAEAMYNPALRATSERGRIEVSRP